MPEPTGPQNFLQFVNVENQQLMTMLVNLREEFDTFSHLDGLYQAALAHREASKQNVILHQLLTFTHYHFYFAASCLMRCHMSEAFSSVRVAIDAALTANTIIENRSSQKDYLNRTKPYDKLVRYYRNIIRDKRPISAVVPFLIERHDFCSQFASHADISVFAHRASIVQEPKLMLLVEYFQFPREPNEMKLSLIALIRDFTIVLDTFSPFLVDEISAVPPTWRQALHDLGASVEARLQTSSSA